MSKAIYVGIGPEKGTIVEEDQAFQYALDRCLHGTIDEFHEFKDMLVDWFYSGNWLKEEKEDE